MSNFIAHHTAIILKPNTKGRDFVCGDIHGNLKQVLTRMEENSFNRTKDRLIAVGDLINRGEDSLGCLRLLREPWFFSTLGNHEVMMVSGVQGTNDMEFWLVNGGKWYSKLTAEERLEVSSLIDSHVSKLPIAITIDYGAYKVGFVHADPPIDWEEIDTFCTYGDTRLWGRNRWQRRNQTPVDNIDIVFVGHTPSRKVQAYGNVIYLDTGSGYEDGWLTVKDVRSFTEEFLATS